MKNTILTALLLLLGLAMQAQSVEVGTYNIRNSNQHDVSEGNGWKQRCPHICEIINFEEPLVFGTQEVLDGQLHDMLDNLPDYNYLGVGRDDGMKAGEYSAIFYRKDKLEVMKDGHFWLSETPDKPSKGWDAACVRICTWALFRNKDSKKQFWFFNLHMDHIGVTARRESAKLVISRIKSMTKPGDSVILTGDFNVAQNNEIFSIFSQSGILKDSYEVAEMKMDNTGTFNGFMQDRMNNNRIDHIFVSPNISVERYAVLTESYWLGCTRRNPSDHYPVMIKLNFK